MIRNNIGRTVGLILAAAGCAAPIDAAPDETPAASEVAVQRQLLASVKLSDTHVIDFWEYEGGQYSIHESLNVDRDLVEGRPTFAELKADEMNMRDTYMYLAGPRALPEAATRLAAVDTWLENHRGAEDVEISPEESTRGLAERAERAASLREIARQTRTTDGLVDKAACAEPPWDWQSDVGWFKNNFCGNDSKFCATEVVWASYGWFRGPKSFKATGFAQSHCSSAHWRMESKTFGFNGTVARTVHADFNLAPRTLDTQSLAGKGDYSWFCKVTSNTGSNRTGLAVHHP